MKKIILTILIISIFASCKKELPSNIKSAVIGCELSCDRRKVNDSIIINLSNKDIDTLSKKTIEDLLWKNDLNNKDYDENSKELEELLKFNPEYSDYDEIKKIKLPYYTTNRTKYYSNIMYLQDCSIKLIEQQYK
jgi:hypothetical protein